MDWTSKMRQGMQTLDRECWNQKGLNNTAVSEIMKLRASFPAVLTNLPSTTENMAKAMWSWIKSSIRDAFAKAPSYSISCMKTAGGLWHSCKIPLHPHHQEKLIQAKFVASRKQSSSPEVNGNFKNIFPCFPWQTGRWKPKLSNLPVHLHCSYHLAPSSPSEVILDNTQMPAEVSNQNLIFYSHFFAAEHCHLSKSTAGSTVWIQFPSSTKPTAPAAVKDLLSLQHRQWPGSMELNN